MTTPPLFVSRINVASSQDTVLVIVGAPAGPVQDGQITTVEIGRWVMSHQTLKQAAQLFAAKVKEIEALERKATKGRTAEAPSERRSFASATNGRAAAH